MPRVRRLPALLLTFALLGGLLPVVLAQSAPAGPNRPQPPTASDQSSKAAALPAAYAGRVEAASDAYKGKVSPSLRDIATASQPGARLPVLVVSMGALPGNYPLQNRVSRRPDANGLIFSFGEAAAADVLKLGAPSNVVQVLDNRATKPFPQPLDRPDRRPQLDRNARIALGADYQPDYSRYAPTPSQSGVAKQPAAVPDSWHSPDVMNVRAAWQRGYKGAGVKVAVLDTGVDFGHPDLQGTMARDDNPASPYYGWPLAYDPWSMEIYNYGISHNADNGAIGWQSWYADTSATLRGTSGPILNATFTNEGWITRTVSYTMPGGSLSGVYHVGLHPDEYAVFDLYHEYMAVAVVDAHTPGVYDTVYTDLNGNHDFRDDAPTYKGHEVATLDRNGDGVADLSAGMIYYIADGSTPIPGGGWLYSLLAPQNGNLVAFMGSFNYGADHGTFCASAVVAQGRINGQHIGYPPYKPADAGGMVQGMAPEAKIIAVGDIYHAGVTFYDAYELIMFGYDAQPDSLNQPQVASLSYGFSGGSDNGWDFHSRYLSYLNRTYAPRLTMLVAAGNGGPGYGSITPPGSSPYVITVGASTQYGETSSFEPISSTAEILSGDVQPWSNRGPSIAGLPKPDVVAVGAWGAGDVVLNQVKDGANAWDSWGGTSLSTPIAAGIVAITAQAYYQAHSVYPDSLVMRDMIKASADNLNYDVFTQGAGQINGNRAVDIALEQGGSYVGPSAINVGAPVAGAVGSIAPGESLTTTLYVTNSSNAPQSFSFASDQLVQTGSITRTVLTHNAQESGRDIARPDYLWNFSNDIPADSDLVQITAYYPYGQMTDSNPRSPYLLGDNAWAVVAYNWRDRNHDGRAWVDSNQNGTVNAGELQYGELSRFDYGYNANTVVQAWVQRPRQRVTDGFFVGLQHRYGTPFQPNTNVTLMLTFYKHQPWGMVSVSPASLSVPAHSSLPVVARFQPPASSGVGAYGGAITVSGSDGHVQYVPVLANLRASSLNARWGNEPARNTSYDSSRITGSSDWDWRPDSGEWRIAFARNVDRIDDYTWLWANTQWPAFPTDLDTTLLNASPFDFFSVYYPALFGSYSQWLAAASADAWAGGGSYSFKTITDGPEEWVASRPYNIEQQLDHEIVHHAVGYDGAAPSAGYTNTLSLVKIGPSNFDFDAPNFYGTQTLTFTTGYTISGGLRASAFGLGQEQRQNNLFVQQYGTYFAYLDVHSAAALEVRTHADSDADVDLFVDHWSNGRWNQVAISAAPNGEEYVRFAPVEDGGWRFRIDGTRVPAAGTSFDLITTVIGGRNMAISPSVISTTIVPGRLYTFTVSYNKPDITTGVYKGQIFLGPANAGELASIPFTMRYGNPTPQPTDTPRPCRASFTDIGESYWAYPYIKDLYCRGIIEGYLDNSYRPNTPGSRGQFAKMLTVAMGWPTLTPTSPSFSDVPAVHWAYPYVETLRARGVASGQNGLFYPNRALSRAEVVKMEVLALELPFVTPAQAHFVDVPADHPFYRYVEAARYAGLVSGYGGSSNRFAPNQPLTRAELARTLYQVVHRR